MSDAKERNIEPNEWKIIKLIENQYREGLAAFNEQKNNNASEFFNSALSLLNECKFASESANFTASLLKAKISLRIVGLNRDEKSTERLFNDARSILNSALDNKLRKRYHTSWHYHQLLAALADYLEIRSLYIPKPAESKQPNDAHTNKIESLKAKCAAVIVCLKRIKYFEKKEENEFRDQIEQWERNRFADHIEPVLNIAHTLESLIQQDSNLAEDDRSYFQDVMKQGLSSLMRLRLLEEQNDKEKEKTIRRNIYQLANISIACNDISTALRFLSQTTTDLPSPDSEAVFKRIREKLETIGKSEPVRANELLKQANNIETMWEQNRKKAAAEAAKLKEELAIMRFDEPVHPEPNEEKHSKEEAAKKNDDASGIELSDLSLGPT